MPVSIGKKNQYATLKSQTSALYSELSVNLMLKFTR